MKNVIVVGGGAAGFFAAITCATIHPDYQITILEKASRLLEKVKVSGGGRCNVTHACFDPRELVKYYPRGEKQLIGPFTRFNPSHIIDWFGKRGVNIKKEKDGRMFPDTDSSQTIIDCFLEEARKLNIKIELHKGIDNLQYIAGDAPHWLATTQEDEIIKADAIILTTGSSLRVWSLLEKLGHKIVPPVPSLFTFNIKDPRIEGLSGLSVENATVHIATNKKLATSGPLLITHWGMSGPAILRLSAWAARELADLKYKFELSVNWTGKYSANEVKETILQFKQEHPRKTVLTTPLFDLPKRLWERLVSLTINSATPLNFADLSNKHIEQLTTVITASRFAVTGKSTYKDEFVTAGGIDLNEVDFKTMQSKKFPGLYFAGEVLDIDAITGGFNFQAAWTTGWIAGNAV